MFWKFILNFFLLLLLFALQISFFSFLPFFFFLNLSLILLIILRLTDRVKKVFFLVLALIAGLLSDFFSPQISIFYLLNLFFWAVIFDWLTERFMTPSLPSVFILSFLGILTYKVIGLLLERFLFLVGTTHLVTNFDKLYFLNLIKFIFTNLLFSTFFAYWQLRKKSTPQIKY
jgi:hypothetical protein